MCNNEEVESGGEKANKFLKEPCVGWLGKKIYENLKCSKIKIVINEPKIFFNSFY